MAALKGPEVDPRLRDSFALAPVCARAAPSAGWSRESRIASWPVHVHPARSRHRVSGVANAAGSGPWGGAGALENRSSEAGFHGGSLVARWLPHPRLRRRQDAPARRNTRVPADWWKEPPQRRRTPPVEGLMGQNRVNHYIGCAQESLLPRLRWRGIASKKRRMRRRRDLGGRVGAR